MGFLRRIEETGNEVYMSPKLKELIDFFETKDTEKDRKLRAEKFLKKI